MTQHLLVVEPPSFMVTLASAEEHFLNPRNVGELDQPSAQARLGSFVSAPVVQLELTVDATYRIYDQKFKVAGCSYLVSGCSQLTEQLKGLFTGPAASEIDLFLDNIRQSFGKVPVERAHCFELLKTAALAAIRSYSDSVRADW